LSNNKKIKDFNTIQNEENFQIVLYIFAALVQFAGRGTVTTSSTADLKKGCLHFYFKIENYKTVLDS